MSDWYLRFPAIALMTSLVALAYMYYGDANKVVAPDKLASDDHVVIRRVPDNQLHIVCYTYGTAISCVKR